MQANQEHNDHNTNDLTPAIRFFGSVDPIKLFGPRKFGFYPVFRGDLLLLRAKESDVVFFCERQIKAHCEQQHLDFLSFDLASMLHAVQYKELRVWLWNVSKEFLHRISNLQPDHPDSIVHIRMPKVSSIPVEAILRCKVAIKTRHCDCENMLFGVELKVCTYISLAYIHMYSFYSTIVGPLFQFGFLIVW